MTLVLIGNSTLFWRAFRNRGQLGSRPVLRFVSIAFDGYCLKQRYAHIPRETATANNSSDDHHQAKTPNKGYLIFIILIYTNDNRKKNHNYRETENMKRKKKTRRRRKKQLTMNMNNPNILSHPFLRELWYLLAPDMSFL